MTSAPNTANASLSGNREAAVKVMAFAAVVGGVFAAGLGVAETDR